LAIEDAILSAVEAAVSSLGGRDWPHIGQIIR
jgi:hypothetical protein